MFIKRADTWHGKSLPTEVQSQTFPGRLILKIHTGNSVWLFAYMFDAWFERRNSQCAWNNFYFGKTVSNKFALLDKELISDNFDNNLKPDSRVLTSIQ